MKMICRWCEGIFTPKVKRGRKPMCCSPECHREYDAYYNKEYCGSDEWKRKRKVKRDDKRKLAEAL